MYLANKFGGEIRGKKKLAKLLYFVDFDFFEKFQIPVTMGKVLMDMVDEKKITIKLEKERADYNPTEIYRVEKKIEESFSQEEQQILDRVVLKYGHLSGKQLEDLTHAEAPYIGTAPNQEIAYELAFYRGTNVAEDA